MRLIIAYIQLKNFLASLVPQPVKKLIKKIPFTPQRNDYFLIGSQFIAIAFALTLNASETDDLHPLMIALSTPYYNYIPFILGIATIIHAFKKNPVRWYGIAVLLLNTFYLTFMETTFYINDAFHGKISVIATATLFIIPKMWNTAWRGNFESKGGL